MSTFKRNIRHQQLVARQGGVNLLGPGESESAGGPEGPGETGAPEGPSDTPNPPAGPSKTPKPPKPTPSSTRSRPDPTPTPTENEESSTRTAAEEETTDKESATSEKSESSSAAVSTKSNTSNSSGTRLATNAITPPLRTGLATPTVTDDIVPSISGTTASDNAPTGAINTGAIIGGIAGGLAGIALLGLIISFFLRRARNRRREEEFSASQFRRSAMIMDGAEDPRPASLFGGRWGGFAPSIRNSVVGGGMAGAGAFRYQEEGATPTTAQPEMQQYHDDYQNTPTTAAALQPRQQYTYGENYDNTAAHDDDITSGAYSEQPQQQAVYNLEAYGDYASYSNHGAPRGRQQDDDAYGGI